MKALRILLLALPLLLAAAGARADNGRNEAVTLWWVIFNNPAACEDGCDGADLGIPEVAASVVYASGQLTGPGGRLRLVGALNESVDGFADEIIGGPGLLDAAAAEIHMVVRSHGPALRDVYREQITRFLDPSCLELGGPNECRDIQFAVHPAGPPSSRQPVFWFPDLFDGERVDGASSHLWRSEDGLVVLLETRAE